MFLYLYNNNQYRDVNGEEIFYMFQDEEETEREWGAYSNIDFTYWSCHIEDGIKKCEPDDHGNKAGNPQDCIALYSSRNYNMSDWECDKGWLREPWTINNVICKNPEYQPDLACNCNCDVCIVRGDPHVTAFDGTYYHPMVCTIRIEKQIYSFFSLNQIRKHQEIIFIKIYKHVFRWMIKYDTIKIIAISQQYQNMNFWKTH